MARYTFGGEMTQLVTAPDTSLTGSLRGVIKVAPGAVLTLYSTATGTTPVTDYLIDADGDGTFEAAATAPPVSAVTGYLLDFQGPDGVSVLYYDPDPADTDVRRVRLTARDAGVSGSVATASTTVQGIVELATNTEATTGTDTARAVTPAGLAAHLTSAKGAANGIAPLDGTGKVPAANLPTSTTGTLADAVVSQEGKGGYILTLPSDTPTGAANEIILVADTTTTGGGTSLPPPGLDATGGIVGCSIADPAMAIAPASTDTEAGNGSVFIAVAGARMAVRVRTYSIRVDRVTWHVGEGSTAAVSGTIAIARASDGVILASNTSQNLTPATVTAGTGNTQTWTLTTPITGLTAGDELVVLTQHTTGTVRYAARGISSMDNISALRTFASGSGELHRAGAIAGAPTLTSPVDFTAAAAWTKRIIPVFVLSRTA